MSLISAELMGTAYRPLPLLRHLFVEKSTCRKDDAKRAHHLYLDTAHENETMSA
jgi:hypothetical protein